MIISASRRTDIPAYYSNWFFNRLKEGFVDVRNPMNPHQVSRVSLTPDVVDCIVFWTKNASPIMDRLNELKNYNYYFHFTLNPYNQQIEKKVPKKGFLLDIYKALADKVGNDKVIWRYDPIMITPEISVDYHLKYFAELAKRLNGYAKICVISFVDLYKKTERNTAYLSMREPTDLEIHTLASRFSEIASKTGLRLVTCSEKIELNQYGIEHGSCIEKSFIEKLCGYKLDVGKDKNQRSECGCVSSIDIGAYNTCQHGCAYCYANYNQKRVDVLSATHNPTSTLIAGELDDNDIIKERDTKLLKNINLFNV
jgi:hypothetical protein